MEDVERADTRQVSDAGERQLHLGLEGWLLE